MKEPPTSLSTSGLASVWFRKEVGGLAAPRRFQSQAFRGYRWDQRGTIFVNSKVFFSVVTTGSQEGFARFS